MSDAEYDKLTGKKMALKDVHFRINTHIRHVESPARQIKINFKLPTKKTKNLGQLVQEKKENVPKLNQPN